MLNSQTESSCDLFAGSRTMDNHSICNQSFCNLFTESGRIDNQSVVHSIDNQRYQVMFIRILYNYIDLIKRISSKLLGYKMWILRSSRRMTCGILSTFRLKKQ
jgi:hypothetical protein